LLRTTIVLMPRTRASIVCIACKNEKQLESHVSLMTQYPTKTAIEYS
jgi:hypothetical protein